MGAAGSCCGPLPKIPQVESKTTPEQTDFGENNEIPEEEPKSYINFQHFFEESKEQGTEPQIYEWVFLSEIGRGALSHVYLCKNTDTDEPCAAKVYNVSVIRKPTLGNEEPPFIGVKREIEIMAKLSHQYVLSIVEVIEDDLTNSLIIIMPFAKFGTLQNVLSKGEYDMGTLATCFYQVAEGLRAIHAEQIVHRDLKPDNILAFSSNYFVLSDFSVSACLDSPDQMLEDTKGSPAFLSPEECSGDPFYPKPADVWSYGVTLYAALFGKLPFNLDVGQGCSIANTVLIVTSMLQAEELTFPEDTNVDPRAIELLKQVLQKDPSKRPTFEEIVANPWFDEAREAEAQAYAEEEGYYEEDNANDQGNVDNQEPQTSTE